MEGRKAEYYEDLISSARCDPSLRGGETGQRAEEKRNVWQRQESVGTLNPDEGAARIARTLTMLTSENSGAEDLRQALAELSSLDDYLPSGRRKGTKRGGKS